MRRFITVFLIPVFFLTTLTPPAQACWWKGLPHVSADMGGAPTDNPPDDQPNQCKIGEPVFLHNGDFLYTYPDLSIASRGLNVEITHTYKSQSRFNGRFGLGWELSYNKRVVPLANGDCFYFDGEGRRLRYLYLDGKNYIAPTEVFDRLFQNQDGTYTLSKTNGLKYNFDQNGLISEIVDRNNNKLGFSYNPEGKLPIIGVPLYTKDPVTPRAIAYQYQLTQITDTLGRKIILSYDQKGRLTQITDFADRIISYTYDDLNHLTSITDPAGYTTTFSYDSDRNLRDIIKPDGRTYLTNTYNPNDQVIAQTQGTATTLYDYDTEKRITTRTDPNGAIWTYYFNEQGNPIKIIDPQGNTSEHTYDSNKKMLLTQTKDSKGNSSQYAYDQNGNLTKFTDPSGNTTTYTYDLTLNKLTSTTDPLGRKTTYEYDAKANLIKVTDPVGNTTTYTYNDSGQLLTTTDANDNTTTYSYDAQGNLTSITDAGGNKTTYAYDSLGRRTSVTDALGNTTQYSYTQTSGCPTGTCTGTTSDRITKITYPDNSTEEFIYDCCNLIKKIDALKNETSYSYDIHGKLTQVTDPLGNITKYTYDNLGNLASITDAENHTTTYTYDSLNRLIKITDPQGFTTQYSYDSNDNLLKRIDANNQITEYEYDSLNQLTKVFYNGKDNPKKTITHTYDKVGSLLSWNDGTYSATYTYDELNRLKTITTIYPFGDKTINYTYDKVGNKKTLTNLEGKITTYNYDSLNRLTTIEDQAKNITTYAYDQASRLIKKTLSNGVYTEYDYNNLYQLTELVNKKSDGAVISSYTYTLDKVGNRTSMTTAEGKHSYAYDATYRLTSADHPTQPDETYTYDKVGNRKTSSLHKDWSYDANNRLTNYNGTSYTYDQNGNTITKTEAQGKTTYTYDYENRLVSLRGGAAGADEAIYTYDPFGKRLSSSLRGGAAGTDEAIYYLYDNEDIIAEYASDGSLTASYTHGQGIDEPISMTRGANTYYYTMDGLGSVTELTDGSQNVVEGYHYDSFGKLETPPATGNPYTYTSREYDSESGLYFYRARYYNAEVGRFLTADPIGFDGGINFYVYVGNNPVNFDDPAGLTKVFKCGRCIIYIETDPWKGKHAHWKCPGMSKKGCVKPDGSSCENSPPPPSNIRECLEAEGFFVSEPKTKENPCLPKEKPFPPMPTPMPPPMVF